MSKNKQAGCKCLNQVQRQLAKERPNARLQVGFNMKGQVIGPYLAVEKIDPKKRDKLLSVICAHCPFCGKKLPF